MATDRTRFMGWVWFVFNGPQMMNAGTEWRRQGATAMNPTRWPWPRHLTLSVAYKSMWPLESHRQQPGCQLQCRCSVSRREVSIDKYLLTYSLLTVNRLLHLSPENGGSMFLRNFRIFLHVHTELYPKSLTSKFFKIFANVQKCRLCYTLYLKLEVMSLKLKQR
jgi:hypothetical protein